MTQDRIQKTPFGCGMYAVAKAIDHAAFVSPERLNASQSGNDVNQLNGWLKADGRTEYLEPIYRNLLSTLPPSDFGVWPIEEKTLLPLVIEVAYAKGGKKHMVAAHVGFDRKVAIYDSLREESISATWEELVSGVHYPQLDGVFGFIDSEKQGTNWRIFQPIAI